MVHLTTDSPAGFGVPWAGIGPALKYALPVLEYLINHDRFGNMVPNLAEDWDVAEDGKSITFYLRKGVKFHDGSDFNASVVVWNLNHWIEQGSDYTAGFESFEILDDYTLKVNITQYKNTMLSNMGQAGGCMMSQVAYEKNGEEWCKYHPIGTGAFKFKAFERDKYLELERNEDYWGERPYLDGIKYMFISDIMTAAMALQAGQGHVLWMEQVQVMGPDLAKKGYEVALGRLGMFALIPDSTNPDSPLANKKVREAIEYAIDKETIAQTLGKGYWEAYYNVAPSNTIGYIPGFEGRRYNPTKAKELLAEAGYPNGFKTTLMTYTTGDIDPLLAAQANLKAVGIDLELDVASYPKYMTAMFNGWESGFFLGMFGHLDPNFSNYMQRYFGAYSTYFGGVGDNAKLDRPDNVMEDCDKAMLAMTLEDQKAAINEAVMAIYEDETVIPLWTFTHAFAVSPKFHDAYFGEPCASYWNWYSSWLEK